MISISTYLRRGLIAGLVAGLLAGAFAFFFGEPSVEAAIQLEEAAAHEHGGEAAAHDHEEAIVSRSTQSGIGLFFATGLTGAFVGGLFGLSFAYFRGRLNSASDWAKSVTLAAAIFGGAVLVPFLKYPANPPTVGDPETIGARTASYLTLVALSLLVVLGAWLAARTLQARGVEAPLRQSAVGLGVVVVVGVLFLILPASPSPGEFPAGTLWEFRLSSLGTQLVLWAGLGVAFGLLCERANRDNPLG